jgi:hypothetical protein
MADSTFARSTRILSGAAFAIDRCDVVRAAKAASEPIAVERFTRRSFAA